MNILVLSRYDELGASSRLRFFQYIPLLESNGFTFTIEPFFDDIYVKKMYSGGRPLFSSVCSYLFRLRLLFKTKYFDLVWVEKEIFPWLPSWIELSLINSKVALVVDYDDAINHKYDCHRSFFVRYLLGNKIDAVMRRSNLVVAGNEYIANHAKEIGARWVELLPTVVDLARYKNIDSVLPHRVTIGWIGSPITAEYLKVLATALRYLVNTYNVRIVAIGANAIQFSNIPIEVVKWSENTEVAEISKFDIGIMPLPDEPFERGKCGYKLIQYMACGKPVVASPVGVNLSIVEQGVNGFLASTVDDWKKYLGLLCVDSMLRRRLGSAGRNIVEKSYSLNVTAPRLEILLKAAERVNVRI